MKRMNATVVHDATKLARDLLEKGLQIMDFERSPGEIADEEAAFKEKQGKTGRCPRGRQNGSIYHARSRAASRFW